MLKQGRDDAIKLFSIQPHHISLECHYYITLYYTYGMLIISHTHGPCPPPVVLSFTLPLYQLLVTKASKLLVPLNYPEKQEMAWYNYVIKPQGGLDRDVMWTRFQ